MALEHSSTVLNSTKANFFSELMNTFWTQSGLFTAPTCAPRQGEREAFAQPLAEFMAWLNRAASDCSSTVGGRPPR